jgi:uroporphyrinogen III methyltransferase / synthase
MSSKVYLVGGGPGDPGLITLRAREVLGLADVVIYDALINEALLSHLKPGAEKIYVGKRRGWHALSQEEISTLLVERAQQGQVVVRLKGGDPFLFGRGGEEAIALFEAKIPFEVVPGVSSALSVPAYAGIPVTHRELCRVLTICTGHSAVHGAPPLDFSVLARLQGTLVFLMSLRFMRHNIAQLLLHGMSAQTPAAVIEWGTLPRQRVVTAPLHEIAAQAEAEQLGAPSILVVGEVVKLREKIAWYVPPPLTGKRVLVTRAKEQAEVFCQTLQAMGATPVLLPSVSFRPLPIDLKIFSRLSEFQWAVFTSSNAVRFFFEAMKAHRIDARHLGQTKLVSVGKKTEETLLQYGLFSDLSPKEERAEGVPLLFPTVMYGQKFLLPRPARVAFDLAGALSRQGAVTEELLLYENVAPPKDALQVESLDILTFASPSALENLLTTYPEAAGRLRQKKTIVIGPTTEAAARRAGFIEVIVAASPSIEAMIEAML